MSTKKPTINDKAFFALKPAPDVQPRISSVGPARLKTGPGALVAHLAAESDAMRENDALRAELKAFDGANPSRKIDPRLIRASKWANRHDDAFRSKEFAELKVEIESAGGNVQPIKVRPVTTEAGEQYEIVFGHRRHRACLELGFPVLCIVESITDKAMFQEMDRENRHRADLRPYEQGEMYRRALDDGLFPSLRSLAEGVGIQPGHVSTALQIARLPDEVLDAFPSRLDIQYRWGKPLTDLLKTEADIILQRSRLIAEERSNGTRQSAGEVFARLTATAKTSVPSREIKVAGALVASIRQSGERTVVEFEKGALPKHKVADLEKAILRLLS